jgi:predicted metal-dependent HD superfamily phosphohydrolase
MFSIFYHDIVYSPRRRDNEGKSADIASDRLAKLGVPTDKILKCRQQILATKDHRGQAKNDTDHLVDFDLAILGDTPEKYWEYAKKIRKEYWVYPNFLYKKGRKKVLRHFLGMETIFKTPEFYENLEQRARENLKSELQELR